VLYSPTGASTTAGVVPVSGRVHIPEPLVWRLEYGVGPSPIGWGVLSGPHPSDPDDGMGREVDGSLGDWDVPGTAAQHDVSDFSLRLAAYDPANMDYPVAVSEMAYVILEAATATPTPSPTFTVEATLTASATPEATASPTPAATPTPEVAATPTVVATPEVTASPTLEPTPSETPIAAVTPEPTLPATAVSPGAVLATIAQPQEGAQVTGQVEVLGTAGGSDFNGYVVEYAPGDAPQDADWQPAAPPSNQPVSEGMLALWQTDPLTPGIYSLRLRVFDTSGAVYAAQVRVNVTR
jgi:hypothetical protein